MKALGSVNALALVAALAAVGAASALAVKASDDEVSTRHTYVVGGTVVHQPRPHIQQATLTPVRSGAYSTRHAYVVGGELVAAER